MSLLRRRDPDGASGSPQASGSQTVVGERSTAAAHRVRSLESRVGNLLALGLICALGFGLLVWYYGAALRRPARAARSAQALTASRAQSEMPLPPLGPIPLEGPPILGGDRIVRSQLEAPTQAAPLEPPRERSTPLQPLALPQLPLPQLPLPQLPLLPQPAKSPAPLTSMAGSGSVIPYAWTGIPSYSLRVPSPGSSGAAQAPRPRQSAFERRLSGPVFAGQSDASVSSEPPTANGEAPAAVGSAVAASATEPVSSGKSRSDGLAQLLIPSATPAAIASVLPTRSLLLPKGAFIDCTLETAIDSTLPGMTTCITATDTFGADGKVVLLERGSKLIGETRGEVQQGSARVFVLWTEARTPTGVVIPLASPGTDELGRSGLQGEVNRHFWERFGAAILVSIIDAGAQAAVQSGNGTVIYDPTTTQDVTSEVLKQTLNIPPTVVKSQGDRIQVLVARDLDFRSVYELHASAER